MGASRINGSGATGLHQKGNFTHIDQPSISGFTNNILIGVNAFLDTIIAPTIWNGHTGLNVLPYPMPARASSSSAARFSTWSEALTTPAAD